MFSIMGVEAGQMPIVILSVSLLAFLLAPLGAERTAVFIGDELVKGNFPTDRTFVGEGGLQCINPVSFAFWRGEIDVEHGDDPPFFHITSESET